MESVGTIQDVWQQAHHTFGGHFYFFKGKVTYRTYENLSTSTAYPEIEKHHMMLVKICERYLGSTGAIRRDGFCDKPGRFLYCRHK